RPLGAERAWTESDVDDEGEQAPPPAARPKKRSPWTWPFVGLILLVLFALLGAWLVPMLTAGEDPSETATATRTTRSASPTTTSASPTQTQETQTQTQTRPETPETVQLNPVRFQGRPFDEVRAELESLGFEVDGQQVEDNAAEGTVLDIFPSGAVERGATIRVTYSEGPGTIQVPGGLTGQEEQQVREALLSAGLVPQKSGEEPSDEPAGTVLRIDPGEGSEVPNGATVSYVVSSGPEETTEPAETPTLPTTGPDSEG
ncbi:serine/threonine-protein kinase PknA, partial [Arthrobacter crystallopoietes BAB-32]